MRHKFRLDLVYFQNFELTDDFGWGCLYLKLHIMQDALCPKVFLLFLQLSSVTLSVLHTVEKI